MKDSAKLALKWLDEGIPAEWIQRTTLQAYALWDYCKLKQEYKLQVPNNKLGDKTCDMYHTFDFKNRAEFNMALDAFLEGAGANLTVRYFKEHYLDFQRSLK